MIPRVSETANRIMVLWLVYDRWKSRCQLALLAGFMCMLLSLLSAVAGVGLYAGWLRWFSPTENPALLFGLSIALVVGGIIAGALYNRWLPHRQYALERYQKESTLDVW